MENELLNKFNYIIDYNSEYDDSGKEGLVSLNFDTKLEITPTGIIKMDIWILAYDFFNKDLEPKIIYRHQTEFELLYGNELSQKEFVEMFRYTEERFLNTEFLFEDNSPKKIRDIYPTNNQIPEEEVIQLVKNGPSYITNLWK